MFTFGRGRKEEPEKPEFVDLAALRAERQATTQPRPALPPNPMATYLGHPHRPSLPPTDLAREFDDQLAKLLEEASAADGRAVHSQIEWETHQPGQAGFSAVVAQDAAWVQPFVERGDEVPVAGPLYDWLTRGQHEVLVEAIHRRQEADHADRAPRLYAATPELRGTLDQAADVIQEEIRVLLVECKDTKSRRSYERAGGLCPSWNRAASLFEWSMNPTIPYRVRQPAAWPGALDVEEYEAATIGLGETRYEAPDRLLGIPATTVTPGSRSVDTDIHWGPEGPPGSRRARGVT